MDLVSFGVGVVVGMGWVFAWGLLANAKYADERAYRQRQWVDQEWRDEYYRK